MLRTIEDLSACEGLTFLERGNGQCAIPTLASSKLLSIRVLRFGLSDALLFARRRLKTDPRLLATSAENKLSVLNCNRLLGHYGVGLVTSA
jgi:hypothetical protein